MVQIRTNRTERLPVYNHHLVPVDVCLGRSINMVNNLKKELDTRKRRAWTALGPIKKAVDQLTVPKLPDHLFDLAVLTALRYAAETRAHISTTSRNLYSNHQALERYLLKSNWHSQRLAGTRVSDVRNLSHFWEQQENTLEAKQIGHWYNKKNRWQADDKNNGVDSEKMQASSWKTIQTISRRFRR